MTYIELTSGRVVDVFVKSAHSDAEHVIGGPLTSQELRDIAEVFERIADDREGA